MKEYSHINDLDLLLLIFNITPFNDLFTIHMIQKSIFYPFRVINYVITFFINIVLLINKTLFEVHIILSEENNGSYNIFILFSCLKHFILLPEQNCVLLFCGEWCVILWCNYQLCSFSFR